ncbi:hypothetical protein [Rummeliibacillus pycnus]|uniref:hypothetical protein n=1 Tax=Rummeliibacillus pycnus TaxID=101070 RepID=UPI000C99D97D|nr:hypothetical protein [Rummeliibacillus pycnus]
MLYNYSNFKIIFFTLSLIATLGFLIVYGFLYGYYFSGTNFFDISYFSFISSFIPFDIRTLSFVSVFFIAIYYFTSNFILSISSKNKTILIISICLSVLGLNFVIATFFSNEISWKANFSFLIAWLYIGGILISMYLMFSLINSDPKIFNHFIGILLLGIILFLLFIAEVNSLVEIKYSELKPFIEKYLFSLELLIANYTLILALIILCSSLMLFKISVDRNRFHWFYYTYTLFFIIEILIIFIVNKENRLATTFIIMITLLIGLFLFCLIMSIKYFKKVKKQKKYIPEEEITKQEDVEHSKEIKNSSMLFQIIKMAIKLMKNKDYGTKFKVFMLSIILILIIFLPRLSIYTGQTIRNLNIESLEKYEVIYVTKDDKKHKVTANYFIETDNHLYISNEKWKLYVLKSDNYYIESIKKASN